MQPFDTHESAVRSYCRDIPALFTRAEGSWLWDSEGQAYLDFFSGAGALNYGHNHPALIEALRAYLDGNGVSHSLDLHSEAKAGFIEKLVEIILEPRNLDYRILFPGPTGTNAVEASLKTARKVTGRYNVVAFTGGLHGMTLGALAATANLSKRTGAGVQLDGVTRLPFDGFLGADIDSLNVIEQMLCKPGAGIDPPAALLLETVQCEGGLNVASRDFLRGLSSICQRIGALLIIDDIQAGCGRTGPFFSFEPAGIIPDLVCLSKSLSGLGLPLSVVLVSPEHDVLSPGQHNGTFRGNNHAFVTATAALDFWQMNDISRQTDRMGSLVADHLEGLALRYPDRVVGTRGIGMAQGLVMREPADARQVTAGAYKRNLIMETCGPLDEVVKLMPSINITERDLVEGLARLDDVLGSIESAAA